MHEELILELLSFAQEHNLIFSYDFDDKLKIYLFKFQNQEKTWEYHQKFSEEQLNLYNASTIHFAFKIIDTLQNTTPSYN